VLAGVIAQAVDGYMPADQETIRYTGISGYDASGRWYLNREILGGGSGGRYYADGSDTIHVVPESRNLPVEFVENRFPVRVETLGLATDSGGAGTFRGGLGYRVTEVRRLRDGTQHERTCERAHHPEPDEPTRDPRARRRPQRPHA